MPHPRAITLGVPGKIVSKQTEGKRMKWTSAVKYAHNNKLNENKWTSAVKYAHNKKLNENKWTSAVKCAHNNKLNENEWNELAWLHIVGLRTSHYWPVIFYFSHQSPVYIVDLVSFKNFKGAYHFFRKTRVVFFGWNVKWNGSTRWNFP